MTARTESPTAITSVITDATSDPAPENSKLLPPERGLLGSVLPSAVKMQRTTELSSPFQDPLAHMENDANIVNVMLAGHCGSIPVTTEASELVERVPVA